MASTPPTGGRGEGDLEAQLLSLYEDRARLHRELGTADPDEIIQMVRNLEEQLLELYRERAEDFAQARAFRSELRGGALPDAPGEGRRGPSRDAGDWSSD